MRKIIWSFLALVVIGGVVYLTCIHPTSKTLATSTAGKITTDSYYNRLKKTDQGKKFFAAMLIEDVLDKQYGDKVTDSDVTKALDAKKAANPMMPEPTTDDRSQMRSLLVQHEAIKANHSFSDDEIKKAYENYKPEVTVAMITTDNDGDAKKAIDELNNGTSWDDVFKKYNKDKTYAKDNGQLSAFDSLNNSWPDAIKDAAFKLDKPNDYTHDPVAGTPTQQNDNATKAYVLKLVKKTDKPAEDKIKSKLMDNLTETFLSTNDEKTMQEKTAIFGKCLTKADVSIKDSDLKQSIDMYTSAAASQSKK